ncbi:NmrA family transcriptional regulator [Planoprotostelium fungivorum]|uniref:NmrA family transcriptional regulator n=1 Tax=Planoprotostelium fungivorum TaxID=1890364 RepID=A0A2P6NW77_9EUKA|nr:NmrA family transcriptional regulator [Planoprotostelium fungivorum]
MTSVCRNHEVPRSESSVPPEYKEAQSFNTCWAMPNGRSEPSRDTEKPAAISLKEKGAEVVKADIQSYEELLAAFTECHAVFAVTNFWEHQKKEREVGDGKRMADAAKAAGVQHFIWSSVDSVDKISNGKITKVQHFDGKYEVEEYIRSIGLPASFVLCAAYFDVLAPKDLPNGVTAISLPVPSDTKISAINTAADYGKFVRAALDMGQSAIGKRILACTDELTPAEMVEAWNLKGKKVVHVQPPKEVVLERMGEELWEMMRYFAEYGYYGGADVKPSQELVKGKLETYKEWVEKQ